MPGTNAIAYYEKSAVKSFITLATGVNVNKGMKNPEVSTEVRINPLPDYVARQQQGSHICFATFI